MAFLDFSSFERATRPNNALAAPEGFCQNAAPDNFAPVFNASMEALQSAFMQVLEQEPRIEIVEEAPGAIEFIQRSRLFKFPDDVSVRFIAIDAGQSSLAIYSRARVGYGDMGVNRKRVARLITALQAHLAG